MQFQRSIIWHWKIAFRECKIRANLLHPAVNWPFFRCTKKMTSPSLCFFFYFMNEFFNRFWNIRTALDAKCSSNFGVGRNSTMFSCFLTGVGSRICVFDLQTECVCILSFCMAIFVWILRAIKNLSCHMFGI